ncbi:hypothetical protein [Aestuariivirga sp.]|uniref:hypothetical protein n=1 Tax=Aestuariivirga sp. TaxID=2650926 RepID=UPI0035B47E8C
MLDKQTLYSLNVNFSFEAGMATIIAPTAPPAVFPQTTVVAVLTKELLNIARDEAQLRGIPFPPDQAGQMSAGIPMDSLTIVDVLCTVDPVVGFELKESIVKTGGFDSVQEAIDYMVPRIEKAWQKHGSPKSVSTVP